MPANAQNGDYRAQSDDSQQPYSESLQAVAHAPLSATHLEQLVAPIALYPDTLVAQVLAASTYPEQIQDADRWMQAQGYASPEQIAESADAQPWDPAVKALAAFPRVLAQMDRNLQWTTDLGNAYYNQVQDVLEAVQVMRRRARAAATLETTPQEIVHDDDRGFIEIDPPSPQLVYVPTYNPWTVYGESVTPYPGFSLLGAIGEFLTGAPLRYGLGIAMSAFSHTPWGWLAWGINWLAQAVFFNHGEYFSHSTTVADWGFPHRGFHTYAGREGFNSFSRRYARGPSGEGWNHFGERGNGWSSFHSGRELQADNWRSHSDRGFQTFRSENSLRNGQNSWLSNRMQESRAMNRSESFRRQPGSSRQNFRGSQRSYRAATNTFASPNFRGRSSAGFSSHGITRSPATSRSSGPHLFGGHSQNHLAGNHSSGRHFGGGGHAPKSFGGGRSHRSGGHSGGHGGGGRHHH